MREWRMEDGGREYMGGRGRGGPEVDPLPLPPTCHCMYVHPCWPPCSIDVASAGALVAINAAAPAAACCPLLVC